MLKATIEINDTANVVVYENGFFITQNDQAVSPTDIGYRTDSREYKDVLAKVIKALEGFNTIRAQQEIKAIRETQNI